ncbi:hypothetical protein [Fluviicola sp.]|uniref:hypothetical protein n=1 Tax=Fluviicola sp. TaxID=1917219 RepID=UPI003D280897
MEEAKTIASDELLMEQLQNRNWDEFWLRLMSRCFWILRKRYGVRWNNNELKEFSRDIISEVISKIFVEKERHWYIDSYPDFEKFIISAIDSHINNTLKKKKSETSIGDSEFILDQNEVEQNVQEIVIAQELRQQIYEELESVGAEDDELLIFECLADGIIKPDDIRTELGMSESDFHNGWRRFKRKRKVIQEKIAAYGY